MIRLATLALLVCLAFAVPAPAVALQVNPLEDGTVSVHIRTRGETRSEATLKAKREAVIAAAGRVLLDNQLLRADELLTRYLENYAPNFVLGVEVLRDTFTGGMTEIESRVFIDYPGLVNDLTEKRFLYSPAYKPQFTVFLEERLEGARMPQPAGRSLLQNALIVEGLKAYPGTITEPPTSLDLSDDPLLMRAGIIAAERRNVEYIVTGKSNTWLREERQILYDTFYFYDCEMTIQAVRVDTGEPFFETTARSAASGKDQADAIQLAIDRAARIVAQRLEQVQDEFWPKVVQSDTDFEVLLTGTSEELTSIIGESLRRLGPDARVSLKKAFGTSAILTISTDASRSDLIEVLQSTAFPVLRIVREVGDRKFEVQVSG